MGSRLGCVARLARSMVKFPPLLLLSGDFADAFSAAAFIAVCVLHWITEPEKSNSGRGSLQTLNVELERTPAGDSDSGTTARGESERKDLEWMDVGVLQK